MAAQELRKALETTSQGGNGANNLLPYDLDPTLNEELLKLQPLAELIQVVSAKAKTHEYTIRTAHPQGWFEGESTPASNKTSSYQRKSTMLKIQRAWGSVSGFAQTMDEAFIDALATELTGTLEGLSNVVEYSALWATANDLGFSGDAYQFSGIFPYIAAQAPQNVFSAGGAKVSLDILDQAYASMTGFRGVRNDEKMWMMGLRMKQVVDGLQTRIQIPLTQTHLFDGRIVMDNYFGLPILESDYVVPATSTSSPAVTATPKLDSTSALTANTYTYQIASVTITGEQVAGTASAGATADGTHKSVDLSWTADPAAKLYMIFRKTGAGAYGLLDIIAAQSYNSDGSVNGASPVVTYNDNGTKTPVATVLPLQSGEQNIFLINRNPDRGFAFLGKVDDMGRQVNNMFSYVELARVKDSYDYMIKGYMGMRCKYPNVAAAVIRNVKTA